MPVSRPDQVPATRRLALVAVLAAPLMLAAIPAQGAETKDRLRQVERSLDESRALDKALNRQADSYADETAALKRRTVAAARKAQNHETRVSRLENAISALHRQQVVNTNSLDRRRRQLAGMLAALQRLARNPPAALVAMPMPPSDTVRSAILLRGAVPRLERQARELRTELKDLAALRSEISRQRADLTKAGNALKRERESLAGLIAKKSQLERRTRTRAWAARARAAELAAEAADLRGLLKRLARPAGKPARQHASRTPATEPPASVPTASVPTATTTPGPDTSSNSPLPARGRIVGRFGQRSAAATTAKGVTIETRAAAQVIAPGGGKVVFAGPFRGYGELLIIEHDGGYHVLLAGMSRIDAVVGDDVLAGEPVGVMDPASNGKPTLYFELRRGGVPINPLPWIAATRNKVSG